MKILAIECACPPGTLALLQDGEVIAAEYLRNPQRTTQQFAIVMQRLLDQANWQPTDIQLVATTTGPGSFTGLRIGVTAAKVFAYAVGVPTAGLNTLRVIAAQVPPTSHDIEAVLNAQRGQLFVARFRQTSSGLDCCDETKIVDASAWLAERAPRATLTGFGLEKVSDSLLASNFDVADRALWAPTAATVGQLAFELSRTSTLDTPLQLVPRYFRKSAAEEKLSSS